jgi:hypothetical protein
MFSRQIPRSTIRAKPQPQIGLSIHIDTFWIWLKLILVRIAQIIDSLEVVAERMAL